MKEALNTWSFWFVVWLVGLAGGSLVSIAMGAVLSEQSVLLLFVLLTGWTLHMRLDEMERKRK